MAADHEYFRAIRADPFDPGPLLVYADVLEERGGSERAELIRLEVAAGSGVSGVEESTLRHLEALRGRLAPRLVGDLPAWDDVSWGRTRGGLIQSATFHDVATARRRLPDLLNVSAVGIGTFPVWEVRQGRGMARLAESRALTELWGIAIQEGKWSSPPLATADLEILLNVPWKGLRALGFEQVPLERDGLEMLLGSPVFEGLVALSLAGVTNEDINEIACSVPEPKLARLRSLSLDGRHLKKRSAEALAAKFAGLPGLRLRINRTMFPARGIFGILREALGPRLVLATPRDDGWSGPPFPV